MLNKKWRLMISLLTSCVLFFILAYPLPANAAVSKKKLSERKLTEIKKKLKTKKALVKDALKKEKSVLSRIQNIDKNIRQKTKELKGFDKQISQTQTKILSLSKDINALSIKLSKRKSYLKNRLKTLYKQQYGGYALLLFTAKDYQDLIRKSKFISLVAYHDSRVISKYRNEINAINLKKENLKLLYGKIETNKKNAKLKKKALQTDRRRKDKLLLTIRSKRSSYEKAIRELEDSSRKLQDMIKKLAKKKVPKSIVGKGFRAWKGRLPWPVSGRVVVPYGKYTDPKFKITVLRNGIEIKSAIGAKPKAVAGGRVVYADWFKGYGLLLIINHSNGYHSLYGNLTEIFHKTGDIINKGTTVGKIGKSSFLNIPTLYFEIRHKGKPVNPMKWLKKKVRRKI
jgi:septal ring factor EnvC (AmiA/AmiB activator)